MTFSDPSRPPLDRSALTSGSSSVEVIEEAASTNSLVADRARAGAAEGLVLVAEHQTAGRGRLDRSWETPPRAALTFSLLVRPAAVPAEQWSWLPLLAGVAVVDAITAAGGPDVGLKWPNDIECNGRKLGGLLVERVDTPGGPAAVIGIGLNVSTRRDELPIAEATSLALEGADLDRTGLLAAVLDEFGDRYRIWKGALGQPGFLADDYRSRCVTLGEQVRADLPGGEVSEGTATGIGPDGSLLLSTDLGQIVVRAGDVVHLRPFD